MAELKEYVSQKEELGSIHISQEVIASIAAVAATEVEGVTAIAGSGKELTDKLGRKTPNPARGVHLMETEQGVTVALAVIVRSDAAIVETAYRVQEHVMDSIRDMTGLKVNRVDVRVAGVSLA